MNKKEIAGFIKNKKIASIDFGLKRVGLAVCDRFHVTINPRDYLLLDNQNFWNLLINFFERESVDVVVVGTPIRLDYKETEIITAINAFILELESRTGKTVFMQDESYSSKEAMRTMIEIGKSRSARRRKGNIDKIAAAVILRDFLNEIEG
ncbi:MAG: putative pre6S rRNA nuclease [Bacteroidota bacterium]|nr:putative pre6S rRNA nuclease [Bacteroidota bacterium]